MPIRIEICKKCDRFKKSTFLFDEMLCNEGSSVVTILHEGHEVPDGCPFVLEMLVYVKSEPNDLCDLQLF